MTEFDYLRHRVDTLQRQRDALLAACEGAEALLQAMFDAGAWPGTMSISARQASEKIRAAIELATKGA